ncbi:MAG: acyl carrier protein [Firmicutes bacterium]|nr:acyl carrier protein [Bacillota bacterium]
MFEEIRQIICEFLEVEPETITEETDLVKDLSCDSLDIITMITNVEELIGRTISEEELVQVRTVGDMVRLVENNK